MTRSETSWGSVYQRSYPDGRKCPGWYIKFRDPATRRYVTIKGGDTREEARIALTRERALRAPQFGEPQSYDIDTFAAEVFLPILESRCTAAHLLVRIAEYTRAARYFRKAAMKDLRRHHMETYFAFLARELAASTLRKHRNALTQLWDAAIDRGVAKDNPCRGLLLPRIEERAPPYVSPEDLRRIYSCTPDLVQPMIILLGETGMRQGEAFRLRWERVQDELGELTIEKSKNGRARVVHLTPLARKVFTDLRAKRHGVPPRPDALVFSGLIRRRLLRWFRKGAEAAGFPTLRVHDLRHVCATHLVRAGVPVSDVAALLGHTTPDMVVRRYGRHQPEGAAARAIDVLARLRGQVPATPTPAAATPPAATPEPAASPQQAPSPAPAPGAPASTSPAPRARSATDARSVGRGAFHDGASPGP